MQENISMLSKAKTLEGYKLANLDETIGTVKGFYFDDHYWTIRYLVADTGNWLTGRQVLISPYALAAVVKEQHHITINLTKQQIESSPSLSSDKPVSRQFELDYYGYYGLPRYWSSSSMWGAYPYPYLEPDREKWSETNPEAGFDHAAHTVIASLVFAVLIAQVHINRGDAISDSA